MYAVNTHLNGKQLKKIPRHGFGSSRLKSVNNTKYTFDVYFNWKRVPMYVPDINVTNPEIYRVMINNSQVTHHLSWSLEMKNLKLFFMTTNMTLHVTSVLLQQKMKVPIEIVNKLTCLPIIVQ